MTALFQLLVFPGFLFLIVLSMAAQFVDRKFHARLQNRIGPPWFQPAADFLKLASKETVIPENTDPAVFTLIPVFTLTAVVVAFFSIPFWSSRALISFPGDIIVVLYLLTIPTFTFFLGGWYSRSIYAMIGAVRTIIQLFAYEVPFLIALLAAALLAGSWSLSGIATFYAAHPLLLPVNIIGFAVALVSLMGKLEKVPFDIPEAETEIVAGPLTEFSGRYLAMMMLARDVEMVVGASLLSAVYLPFFLHAGPVAGFIIALAEVFLIILLISLLRTILARMRIDQMMNFCWKVLAPIALFQVLINLVLKGVLFR